MASAVASAVTGARALRCRFLQQRKLAGALGGCDCTSAKVSPEECAHVGVVSGDSMVVVAQACHHCPELWARHHVSGLRHPNWSAPSRLLPSAG